MFTSGSQAVTGDMRESYDPAGDMNAEGDHEYIDRVAFPDAHEHRLMSSGSRYVCTYFVEACILP